VIRPRTTAIISAVAASASAFIVVSRSDLFGTVAGTVLFTLVSTLVSHWSSESLSRVGGFVRHRLGRGGSSTSVQAGPPSTLTGREVEQSPTDSGGKTRRPMVLLTNWLLVGCTLAAVALSVYSLASPRPARTVETVVVRQQVIEKTVTVTVTTTPPSTDAATTATSTPGTSDPASSEAASSGTSTTDSGQLDGQLDGQGASSSTTSSSVSTTKAPDQGAGASTTTLLP
jgi:hypothetical protein